jgi:hypothetical protein
MLERLHIFLRWMADCANSGWAGHAQRRSPAMNVGASYLFCVGGRLRGFRLGCTRARRPGHEC